MQSIQNGSLIHLIEEIYIAQLLPGVHMEEMCRAFISSLDGTLQWANLGFCTLGDSENVYEISVPLYLG